MAAPLPVDAAVHRRSLPLQGLCVGTWCFGNCLWQSLFIIRSLALMFAARPAVGFATVSGSCLALRCVALDR
jgi:ubiquitin C-terminal hydrolase